MDLMEFILNNYFQFANPNRYSGSVILLNTLGQKVLKQPIGSNDIERIALDVLQQGIYTVQIQYDNHRSIKSKLIKL